MRFYLGVHGMNWMEQTDVPLFVSHRRLCRRRRLPRAIGPVAVDSGAFTELSTYGEWQTTASEYVDALRRYSAEWGPLLQWASPQDSMCEPFMLEKTGGTVTQHQQQTVENLLELRSLAPELPIIPVLQGWTLDDYLRCMVLYEDAGIDLLAEPVVGIGSVCRRQNTGEIDLIVETIAALGVRLHGFGVKTSGLARYAVHLTSSDSMAWSYDARRSAPLPECSHVSCRNCLRYALKWRERVVRRADTQQQRLNFASLSA